jgi:hypothetical protein
MGEQMHVDMTLPARAYLVAYDLSREKLTERAWLDYVVQGAALAQLLADGRLHDTGTDVAVTGGPRPSDEVLGQVLQQARGGDRRDWRALLHQSKATLRAVEDQLVRAGVLARQGRRLVVLDPGAVAGLQTKVRQVLDDGDGAEVDRLDGALVALASGVPMRTVFQRRRRRRDRQRVDDLIRHVSADVPGFERLIGQMRHTRSRAFSAGGPVH